MLTLDQVSVRIGRATLLDGLSLAVEPGRVLAIVGPNGAGKTTALRLLAGEMRPTEGAVHLDRSPLASLDTNALAQRRAVLPQKSALAFGFTALDVVLLGRTPHRSTHRDNRLAAARAMERAGVHHLASRRYPTLSGGEQQRVHLARTLAQLDGGDATAGADRYLLLDEPTSALDLAHQHTVLGVARQQAAAGVGVLTVLHDLNLAAQYADRIAVLAEGALVAIGSAEAVLTPAVIQQAFGISVLVMQNPCASCPLVVPMPGDGGDGVTDSVPVLDPPSEGEPPH
ncbi:MAG: heme ABC transporter ATP-binding protein [Bacteroidota bacterium]